MKIHNFITNIFSKDHNPETNCFYLFMFIVRHPMYSEYQYINYKIYNTIFIVTNIFTILSPLYFELTDTWVYFILS